MPTTIESRLSDVAKQFGGSMQVAGVAMIVLGVIAMLAPFASGVVFDVIFAALLIGVGIAQLAEAFHAERWQRGVLVGISGIVAIVAGGIALARPVIGLIALTFVFIVFLVIDGSARLAVGFGLPRGTSGKGWVIASGIVAIVLALLAALSMPQSSFWLIGTFVGASLVVGGISRLMMSREVRRAFTPARTEA
jgi:uncharacterized membrane protein HdeD (DUF308 family)